MHPSLRSATLQDCILWILRRYRRFRVTGHSMTPLLRPGNEVLIDPTAYTHTLPTPGDIVVAAHPQQPALRIIKRVEFVEPDGRCYLKGANPDASSDSRQFGLVPQAQVMGKVICRFP
ncbi:MAG: nickel-type superoxide dismutase maturation protease [Leptolyngbya sp. SIO1E4]|nr:nickel-type superoxide dismutase maturation protease [Leptolyngbya sp. SIO1E4]